MQFDRKIVNEIISALKTRSPLIQVIVGPRQVGKTTAALTIAGKLGWPQVFAAADAPLPPGPEWIETQWHLARMEKPRSDQKTLLVLDEIQKVQGWSETVKRLWDEEVRLKGRVRPLLLGSSALLVQRGLTESLAGRFYLHRCMHWSWPEEQKAFGTSLDDWLYFGGYPGSMDFCDDEKKWKHYVSDSLIETVLSKDVLQLQPVNKPVLLRHLFAMSANFPAQILSYNKMLGQLQDAGNTTTLAGYVKLLEMAYLLSGLALYSRGHVRKRGSSPKLILWNNALIHSQSLRMRRDVVTDPVWRGHVVENAVGAHLLNGLIGPQWSITYWREGNYEIDFVVESGKSTWAIEVNSGRTGKLVGMELFRKKYPKSQGLVIGTGGIPLETFFSRAASEWF